MEEREQINGISQDVAAALNADVASVRRAVERMQDICMAEMYVPRRPLEYHTQTHRPQYKPTYEEKVEWLREHKALNIFLRNLKTRSHFTNKSMKEFINRKEMSLISSGFCWYYSDEGQVFWSRIDSVYREWYLRKR